jgi:drug/metabolite transporter (DMT)-like permease
MNYLLLAIIPAAFGLNPVIARALHLTFEPGTLTVLRWSFSALIVGAIALARGRGERWRAPLKDYAALIGLGALGMGFCAYAAYVATQTATATTVGLIYACTAALVAGWEIVRGQTRASLPLLAGLVLCIAGVATLLTLGHLESIATLNIGRGEQWAVAGMSMWAFYSVAMRPQAATLTPFASFTVLSLTATLAALPFAALELSAHPLPPLAPVHVAWIAALSLITGVFAFMGYNWSLTRNGAILTAATISLSPLYIAAMAIMLIGEEVHWYHGVALTLVTSGLGAINLARMRPAKSKGA